MPHQTSTTGPADARDWKHDDAIYRRLVGAVPDYAIFLLDPEGYVRSWNAGAQQIKGYDENEIIGRHFSAFYPPEQIERRWPDHELKMARETGRFEDEGWRVRKDGTRFWANVVITRLLDDDGQLLGFSKITRDLTTRREQEVALRWSEERFRLLVEGVRDYAIFMLDPTGHVASWNIGAQQAKGYTPEEIIGQHFSVFYPPEVVASGWPERELEIALAEGRCEDENWRVRKDGTRFWASVVITALYDASGKHIGFAKVTRDLTDKRRVLALEDEGRRVTTFLAMLGHELRNPLAPISNAVSIMQLEPLESERLRMCRDVIARQVQQMTRLVDDLLDVGRITAGKIHLDMQPVELGDVLREAIETSEPFARSRAQALTLDASAAPAWVAGDRTRLLQIASNLIGNATKFTQRNGTIAATLRCSGPYVEFSVLDNGPGIAPHRLRDVFRLFVQGDQDAARSQGGLGLGLSLVQQLVTLHGGEVSAYSAGLGKGAEFIVRLPLVKAPTASVTATVDAAAARARSVLVVDDNRDAAITLAALLQQMGYRTQTAHDAHAALEAMRAQRPDLAILDIGLPQIDGMALAHLIHAEFGESLPLMALTGYGQESDRDAAFHAGFSEYLTKPLAPESLSDALVRIFPD
ncbi:PAS domain S-box protein [Lysobacter sp. KIS68-7]|uniref:PAS domain-containing hybrid sensor histidine kinase/response regulator n=1 Tax=Lysobacter sp. KIS68-7 TaxID=2904252 RepID=UPI001E4B0D1D|nr:PAS domain-containing sensor histidine kinase [Lysobacter sp. KIS68-7]UHQ20690.1 PAS domain S-box protein [Lysobacter sp. KIS68-7]